MRGTRIALAIAVILFAQFAVVIGFRAFVYADMYIAPDAPYGISDVIELVLGVVLLALGGVAIITSLTLIARGPKSNRVAGALLGSFALLLALVLDPLHTAAAKWSSRHERTGAVSLPVPSKVTTSQSVLGLLAQCCVVASPRGEA
jgi:hypothetical protein